MSLLLHEELGVLKAAGDLVLLQVLSPTRWFPSEAFKLYIGGSQKISFLIVGPFTQLEPGFTSPNQVSPPL